MDSHYLLPAQNLSRDSAQEGANIMTGENKYQVLYGIVLRKRLKMGGFPGTARTYSALNLLTGWMEMRAYPEKPLRMPDEPRDANGRRSSRLPDRYAR